MKPFIRILLFLAAFLVLVVLLLLFVFFPRESLPLSDPFPVLSGPYLGQKPPGQTAERFAPGVIPDDLHTAVVFSPDGEEAYWRGLSETVDEIVFTQLEDGVWTRPQIVPFASRFFDTGDPFFSADGQKFYFTSWRPLNWFRLADSRERIWFASRQGSRWSKPEPIGPAVNTMELHWQFSLTNEETLYFASQRDIYRAEYANGAYLTPQKLGDSVNTPLHEGLPFISPDESYLIFSSNGHPDSVGDFDLFVSTLGPDGTWTQAVNLGEEVNSPYQDIYPVVSPDGEYLFFLSNRGGSHSVYWIAFDFLKERISEGG